MRTESDLIQLPASPVRSPMAALGRLEASKSSFLRKQYITPVVSAHLNPAFMVSLVPLKAA
jgi:hypothetical protein